MNNKTPNDSYDTVGGYTSNIYHRVEQLSDTVDWSTGATREHALRDYLSALHQITQARGEAKASIVEAEELRAAVMVTVDMEAKRLRRSQAAKDVWVRRRRRAEGKAA